MRTKTEKYKEFRNLVTYYRNQGLKVKVRIGFNWYKLHNLLCYASGHWTPASLPFLRAHVYHKGNHLFAFNSNNDLVFIKKENDIFLKQITNEIYRDSK